MKIRTRAYHRPVADHLPGRGHDRVHPRLRINIASGMDAERQRISEVLNVHGSLWRALVELKHDQHDRRRPGSAVDPRAAAARTERRQRSTWPMRPRWFELPDQQRAAAAASTRSSRAGRPGGMPAGRAIRIARGAPRAQRDRFRANRDAARRVRRREREIVGATQNRLLTCAAIALLHGRRRACSSSASSQSPRSCSRPRKSSSIR